SGGGDGFRRPGRDVDRVVAGHGPLRRAQGDGHRLAFAGRNPVDPVGGERDRPVGRCNAGERDVAQLRTAPVFYHDVERAVPTGGRVGVQPAGGGGQAHLEGAHNDRSQRQFRLATRGQRPDRTSVG